MKIRTDFVTNSSSSSFVVEITLKTVSGEKISASLGDEEYSKANLHCTAESILQAPDVQTLLDTIGRFIEDDFEKAELESFGQAVKESVKKPEDIASITFDRYWYAWGEFSSKFGMDIDSHAPQVYKLAGQICEAEKNGDVEELERLKKEMLFRLMYFDKKIQGMGTVFPTGFMGSGANCVLDICNMNKLVDFSHKVVAGNLKGLDVDNGIETTVIDMQNRTFSQQAVYGTDKKRDYSSSKAKVADLAAEILAKEEEERQKRAEAQRRYPELCREYKELLGRIPYCTGKVDLYDKYFLIQDETFPADILTSVGAHCYRSYSNKVDYWVVDEKPFDELRIPPYITQFMYQQMEKTVDALKTRMEESAGANLRFLTKEHLLEELQKEKADGYPSLKAEIRTWKSGIPFDSISSISLEGKNVVVVNQTGEWLYKVLQIEREAGPFYKYDTSKWIREKGGTIAKDVSLKCDYLIVGVGSDPNIGKTAKGFQYRAKGKCQIKIIPEDELLLLLNDEDMRSKS